MSREFNQFGSLEVDSVVLWYGGSKGDFLKVVSEITPFGICISTGEWFDFNGNGIDTWDKESKIKIPSAEEKERTWRSMLSLTIEYMTTREKLMKIPSEGLRRIIASIESEASK